MTAAATRRWLWKDEILPAPEESFTSACMRNGKEAGSRGKAWTFTHFRRCAAPLGLAIAGALLGGGCAQKVPAAMGPPVVSVVSVTQKDVPIYGDWVATLEGFTTAQIQPEVSGYLIKQNYREGSFVHEGDVLFEIDPRPFQAVLDQAKGQLAQANAQLGLAIINVNRDTPVAKLHAIPQSQLDNDIQAKLAAEAAVQADQAAVEQAELNLGFTKVHSLIDGIAGIAQTQIGNLVGTSTVLTTVSKVNPIKVYFPISEQEYLRIADKISGSVDFFFAHVARAAGSDPCQWQHLFREGSDYFRGSPGGPTDRNDPHRGSISESREYFAPRAIRASARGDGFQKGCVADTAARGV